MTFLETTSDASSSLARPLQLHLGCLCSPHPVPQEAQGLGGTSGKDQDRTVLSIWEGRPSPMERCAGCEPTNTEGANTPTAIARPKFKTNVPAAHMDRRWQVSVGLSCLGA